MKHVTMEKIVYICNGTLIPYKVKYNQLADELQQDNEIQVSFPRGMYNQRMRQIEKLGYKLIHWDSEPTELDPIYATYAGTFAR